MTPNCPECRSSIAPGDLFTLRGVPLCRDCAVVALGGITDAHFEEAEKRLWARAEDLR